MLAKISAFAQVLEPRGHLAEDEDPAEQAAVWSMKFRQSMLVLHAVHTRAALGMTKTTNDSKLSAARKGAASPVNMTTILSSLVWYSLIWLLATAAVLSCNAAEWRHGDMTKTNDICQPAGLSANLQLLTDADGGVYALKVQIRNFSNTNDVILRVYDVPELSIAVYIGVMPSDPPKRLSKPRPHLKPYEWHFADIQLEKDSTLEWFIRLRDRLSAPDSLPEQVSTLLGVNLFVQYRKVGEESTSRFERAVFDFSVKGARLTRKALEGDPTEKYEKTLGSSGIPLR